MAQEKKEPSRRDFIKTLAGLGLGAAMAQTLYSSLNPKQRAQLVAWAQSYGKPMTYAELGRLIDAAAWDDVVRAVRYQPASYIIYQAPDGSYQAKNGNTGQIEFSDTDAASVIQGALNATSRGVVFLKTGNYIINNPINLKPYVSLVGEMADARSDAGVSIKPSANFPPNQFMLKLISTTNTTDTAKLENIFLYNPNWSTNPVYGLYINAPAGTTLYSYRVRNFRTQYVDKSLYLEGQVWLCRFEDIIFRDANSTYTGTQDITLTLGNGSDKPKINSFINVLISHGGTVTNALLLGGSYNEFINLDINGGKYDESIIKITEGYNRILHYRAQDMLTTTNTKASVYLSGSNATANWIEGYITTTVKALLIDNGAFRNYIKMQPFSNNPIIDATGAGIENVIEFTPPSLSAATAFSLTHTGAAVIYRGYGINMFTKTITANYTATISDAVLLVDASGGARTITLPASQPHLAASGYRLRIVKIDSSANTVTIATSGTDTIEGATSKTLTTQNQKVDLITDGAGKWYDFGSGLV